MKIKKKKKFELLPFANLGIKTCIKDILNKSENANLKCLPFIYGVMQASKTNESVSESSKTALCITVNVLRMLSRRKT